MKQQTKKWLNLQLFAGEGTGGGTGGDSAGDGAASGANNAGSAPARESADAGQRLRELGVPEELIRRRAIRKSRSAPAASAPNAVAANSAQEAPTEEAAAPDPNTTATTEETQAAGTESKRMSWDEIMADPEYNKQMQAVVQSRLRSAKGAEDALGKLTPALEVLARKHGLDPAKLDYEALSKAIENDDAYYEDKALETGKSLEEAKRIDQQERANARAAQSMREQIIADHFVKLEQQGEAMKKVFPGFDLRTELRNPAFARMTAPNVGISVEDAYYAVHRNEIQAAAMQVTAQKTAQKISNAIQAGSTRPTENGTSGRAPSVTTFDYSKASPQQRADFKKSLREKWARGEKVYPGR